MVALLANKKLKVGVSGVGITLLVSDRMFSNHQASKSQVSKKSPSGDNQDQHRMWG